MIFLNAAVHSANHSEFLYIDMHLLVLSSLNWRVRSARGPGRARRVVCLVAMEACWLSLYLQRVEEQAPTARLLASSA